MKLTLEAIQIIDMIANTGSFAKAAEILHKAPSTISYSVAKIEEQLNIQFFERNGPHVTLTPLGQILLNEGRVLLSAANELESRLQKVAQGVEESITLTLDSVFPIESVTSLIREFKQSSCNTHLNINREVMMGVWESLLQLKSDLIIAAGEGPSGGGYRRSPIGRIDFMFCISPSHPLASVNRVLTKNDLLSYPAIVLADSAQYMPLRTAGLYKEQKRIVVTTLEDKIALQLAAIGHGFIPHTIAQRYIESGQLVTKAVMEEHSSETLYLAWRTNDDGKALNWWKERLMANIEN